MWYTNSTLENKGLRSNLGTCPALPHSQSLCKLETDIQKGNRAAQKGTGSVRGQTSALSSVEVLPRSSHWLMASNTDLIEPAKERLESVPLYRCIHRSAVSKT